jgi:hypothetical protein
MKMRLMGAKLFHAGGRTDRHGIANSLFSAILLTRLKMIVQMHSVNAWIARITLTPDTVPLQILFNALADLWIP